MPELKAFQGACDRKNQDRNSVCRLFGRKKEEGGEDPEDLVQNPRAVVVEPAISGTGIEFEGEPKRGDDQEGQSGIKQEGFARHAGDIKPELVERTN